MKRLALLPLVMLAFACGDSTLLQPEEDADLQIVAKRSTPKMLPIKGYGHWFELDTASPWQCPDNTLAAFGGQEMNLTHLGLTELIFLNCWTPAFEFVSQTGAATAANGDKLYWYGAAAEGTEATLDFGNRSYLMGPFWFDGGTGRFEDATGWFYDEGTFAEDLMTGTATWNGRIAY